MSRIHSGILHNASPLSVEAINELERKVLETGEAYAYLDQEGKLCFAMPHGVDVIKKLAWNNAYTINNPIKDGPCIRQAYKKTGLDSSIADKLFTKPSITADWSEYDLAKFETDYEYTVTNGEATITSYIGDGGDIIVPNRLGVYPVVAIDRQSFTFTNNIKSVVILEGIKRIGADAFYNCGMHSIHIPSSVTSIDTAAFSSCYNLTSIQFPRSVEYLPTAVCSNCTALESVIIADGMTSLSIYVFQNCDNLVSVAIPKSLTGIGEGAFDCCDNITDIYYSGEQAQWNAIYIAAYNECLATATVHYNTSADAIQPTERLDGDGQVTL